MRRVPWRRVLLAATTVVVVVSVVLAVTTTNQDAPETATRSSGSSEDFRSLGGLADPQTVTIPEALDFEAPLLDGGTLDGGDYKGRGVAFWFWAPWCTVCNREAPAVERVTRDYQDRVAIVGMAGRDEPAAMRDFVERHDLGFLPHSVDDDGSLWRRFRVQGQPAWVFVQPDGTTRVAFGVLPPDELRAELERLET